MDIQRLHARIERKIIDGLHWQDLFQTHMDIYNEPFSADDLEKIKGTGRIRYRNNPLFASRVQTLTAIVMDEINKTIDEEDNHNLE